ncbi:hypothetical protein [Actinacidiphila bryophytorum]|uniref:Uncharacterized protein n=1 Tax=Actinacidiphila bryophytorum TaxID=1436133 RepID=A0A9W4H0P6_9ACTN|nr:hypothetical protein [Actinacidiphila bryophytorum]MBM9439390.1 hypothetical protein [Actinacidiphila bryophytorum]CAG7638796.1 conserved hypothetical protein [Actinacidiphila bryophytorum]
MSADQAKTPKAPKSDGGTVDPDNIYTEGTPETAPETATTSGTVKPNNIYTEGTRQ